MPSTVSVIISEVNSYGPMTVYRNLIGLVGQDAQLLEETMPEWLLEYLLMNKAPPVPVTKVSFVLLPVQLAEGQDPKEQLPELLNRCVCLVCSSCEAADSRGPTQCTVKIVSEQVLACSQVDSTCAWC